MTLVPHRKNPRGCLLTLKASVAKAVQPNYTDKHDKKLTLGEAFKLLFLSLCQKILMTVMAALIQYLLCCFSKQ